MISRYWHGDCGGWNTITSVLYVDDEPDLCTASFAFLSKMGYSVETSPSVEIALHSLQHTTYDVIVSDYMMPMRDGITLLQEVRKKHGDIPFILFTGKGDEEVIIRAMENKADYYIRKGSGAQTLFCDLAYAIEEVVEKHQTKKALEQSLKKLRRAEEIAGFGYWEYYPEKETILLSHGAQSIYGLNKDEWPLAEIESCYLKGKMTLSESFHYLKTKGTSLQTQYQVKRETDNKDIFIHSIAEYDSERNVVFGVIHDITEQKTAEQALLDSEEKFRSLVTHSLEPILIINLQGTILFANNAAGNLMEADSFSPLTGRNVMECIAPESHEAVIQDFINVSKGHDAYIAEYDAITTKGKRITIESVGKIIQYEGNVADLLSLRDITERKQIEQALRKASRQINLMNNITRHDILNKVTIILGTIEIAEMDCTDPHLLNYFRTLEIATTAIHKQIEFTRLYQDLGIHEPTWQNFKKIVNELIVPDEITLDILVPPITIFADPMLEKVFYNLLDNSIRHGAGVTHIQIFGHDEPDGFRIIWKDNGEGVSMDEKELIFKRGHGKNTGLGLFLVREILALTGISILETGIAGSGAQFELFIPKGSYSVSG